MAEPDQPPIIRIKLRDYDYPVIGQAAEFDENGVTLFVQQDIYCGVNLVWYAGRYYFASRWVEWVATLRIDNPDLASEQDGVVGSDHGAPTES